MGSNRSFGLVFAGVFMLIALWPLIRYAEPVRWWALAFALVFLGLALFAEKQLAPLNRLWFKLGLAMHAIVSPLIMGLLFLGAVTPIGLILRASGKDLLRLRRNEDKSYWISREPPGPAAGAMKNQF